MYLLYKGMRNKHRTQYMKSQARVYINHIKMGRQVLKTLIICSVMLLTLARPNQDNYETFSDQENSENAPRFERQSGGADHHDVVDFGAHTGDHGAFGWYADFPVHSGH